MIGVSESLPGLHPMNQCSYGTNTVQDVTADQPEIWSVECGVRLGKMR